MQMLKQHLELMKDFGPTSLDFGYQGLVSFQEARFLRLLALQADTINMRLKEALRLVQPTSIHNIKALFGKRGKKTKIREIVDRF